MGIDYGFYTFVTSCAILMLQVHLLTKPNSLQGMSLDSVSGSNCPEGPVHAPPVSTYGRGVKNVVTRKGMLVYEDGDIPHPSYVIVAPLGEDQPELDIMAELMKLRIAANTQKEVLIAANRMPPETSVSRMIADRTRAYMLEDEQNESKKSSVIVKSGMPDTISDLFKFLTKEYINSIGVILGVGQGQLVLNLLKQWTSMAGLYLVDPYIHIYKGYEDVANVDDKTHQLIYENLRNQIAQIAPSNKYAFIRDFSFECQSSQLGFVWIDANPSFVAVQRDIADWWPLLRPGGLMGGSSYSGESKRAVDQFASKLNLNIYVLDNAWMVRK